MELRPLVELHKEGEREWIEKHRYFMGIEEGHPVLGNQAGADFIFGNDHLLDEDGPKEPDPNFKHHKSPRNLTWECEYNIAFWCETVEPRIRLNAYVQNDEAWIARRRVDMEKRGLFNYEPYLVPA